MAKDYIPTADIKLNQWLVNLKKSVGELGALSGLTPGEISTTENLCDEYIAQIHSTAQARIHAKSQVSAKKSMLKTHQPRLRKTVYRLKSAVSKTNAKALKLMGEKNELDQATFKPRLKIEVNGDHIEVNFKKRGIAGMQFKVKIGDIFSSEEWTDLGVKMLSPLKYKPKGYPQGTLLRVWIMGVAIVKDEPFGLWSDAGSILYVVE